MGTLVGMEFTKQHPELVSHLVLSGSVIPKSDSMKTVFSERVDEQTKFLATRNEVRELIMPYLSKGARDLRTVEDIDKSPLTHKDLTEYWRIGFAAVNLYDVNRFNLLKGGRAYYKQDASVMIETVNWNYDYREVLNGTIKARLSMVIMTFLIFREKCFQACSRIIIILN